MKRTKTLLYTLAVGLLTVSCTSDKEELTDPQSAIPLANVSARSEGPGLITVSWTMGSSGVSSDCIGVMVSYFDPILNHKVLLGGKPEQGSVVASGLAECAGTIDFTVTSYSSTGDASASMTTSAVSRHMAMTYTTKAWKDIPLSADQLSTNAQEESEGPIENLTNGDLTDYFHSDWHGWVDVNQLHNIIIDLKSGTTAQDMILGYAPRPGKEGESVKDARVSFSKDGNNWSAPTSVTFDMPKESGVRVNCEYFSVPADTRYIRLEPTSRYDDTDLVSLLGTGGGDRYFHMAELWLSQVTEYNEHDPEIAIKEIIESNKKANATK